MKNKQKTSYTGAIVASVLLHALLIGGLLWGADFTKVAHQPSGQSIEAVVIDPNVVNEQARKIRQQRDEAKRQEDDRLRRLEQQAQLLEKQREQEEKRLRELKAEKLAAEKEAREAEAERKRIAEAKKKAAEEQRKAEDAARIAKEKAAAAEAERLRRVEEQRKADEAAKKAEEERQRKLAEKKLAEEEARKAEEERQRKLAEKKKAEEEARKAEAARKEAERKAAEARRQQAEQEAALNELFSGLESESATRDTARGRFVNDEVARFGAIYTQMIKQNLLVDDNLRGQECIVKMRISGTGLLLDVSEVGGNPSLCRATKAAVLKVSSFPMPDDKEIAAQLQNIELTVKPE